MNIPSFYRWLVVMVFLPLGVGAKDVYNVRPLSEREILKTYTSLMADAVRYSDRDWHVASFDSQAGFWGTGRADQQNEGLRAIGQMVLTCATLVKQSDALNEAERQEYSRKAIAALRFAVATHVSGTRKCPDGKPWGRSWQSAMWTGTMGFGAWLMWDDLDADLRNDVERIIAAESDRFLADRPTGGSWSDTKAEENGWNLICIAIAENMFPAHPHAAAWHEKAIEYMMNTLSVDQDLHDKSLIENRPVSDWVTSPNLHPDFTLENHGVFHPSYMACSSYFMTQTAMYYTYAKRPVPAAAAHHLMDTWRMFQTVILPYGEAAFVQGMDWELHGTPVLNLCASLGTYQKDPLGATLERNFLQYFRGWQNMEKGNLAVPGSKLGFTRHSIMAEQAAYGYLAHKIFGPPAKTLTPDQLAAQLRTARNFSYADFVVHRTDDKLLSFSWKNRIVGMVIPIGKGHDNQPQFSFPLVNGLCGSFQLKGIAEGKAKVEEHASKEIPNGFETTGTMLLNGGALKQTLKMTSLGEKTVVYQDRVVAQTNVTVTQELGAPLGIENDELTGGIRVVDHPGGRIVFDWTKPQKPVALSGAWANVDGRLGVVSVEGSGINYHQATEYNHIAVFADVIYGSRSDQPRAHKTGEEVAHRIVLFFTEVSPKQTAALAKTFHIEDSPDGRTLRFKLPEGGEGKVPCCDR